MMRRPILASLAATLAVAPVVRGQVPGTPPAPAGRCPFTFQGRDSTRSSFVKLPSGQYNSFLGGGVTGRCSAQNITIVSDSAEYFGDTRTLHLIGHVHYTEPRLTSDAQTVTYFMREERLLAEGNVHTTMPSGTTVVGPTQEYYRAVPGVRAQSRMVAPGRPTIDIAQHDSTGAPAPPTRVVANTIVVDADSLVYASGNVNITRPDVVAYADSATLDSGREFARLMRRPRIDAKGDRPFTLSGTVIDMYARERLLERVLAAGSARGVSQDATMTADTLDFRIASSRLQHVYGWGPSRSRATNPTFDIVSDSMDIRMPDQQLREVRAVRRAYAQSTPDSSKFRTTERDWLRGDTILAYFDSASAARGDSARRPTISRLVALGNASSFYQMRARDTSLVRPAINYVRGRDITVAFASRQVSSVTVAEQATGVYLEPELPGAKKPAAANGTPGSRRRGRSP